MHSEINTNADYWLILRDMLGAIIKLLTHMVLKSNLLLKQNVYHIDTCISTDDANVVTQDCTLDSSSADTSYSNSISNSITNSLSDTTQNYPNEINLLYTNCCGLKNKLCYPEFQELIQKHDILCFVETKTDDLDELKLPGYIFKMKNRKMISRVKSGGIVLGYKNVLSEHIEVLNTDCKYIMWCKFSKLFNQEDDVILGIVYIPPEYTSYSSPDAFSEIENEYIRLTTTFKNIFFVGDFNARTSEENDYIFIDESDIGNDLEGIHVNEVCSLDLYAIPRKRNNQDKCKNRYGNQLLDFCKGNNIFILNGRLESDRDGKFTCRRSSVVDYCLTNVYFLKFLVNLEVMEFSSLYSDVHSPLSIKLMCRFIPEKNAVNTSESKTVRIRK